MVVSVRTRVTPIDSPAIKRLVDAKGVKALKVLAATTRREAQRLIRRRLRPSRPGEPPSSPTGRLKQTVSYAVEQHRRTSVVGPYQIGVSVVPGILEHGGMSQTKGWKPVAVGSYAPIRVARSPRGLKGKKQWPVWTLGRRGANVTRVKAWTARTLIRTSAQAERANRILTELYGPPSGKKIRIAPRPYTRPAQQHVVARAPEILRRTIGE